MYTSQKSSNKMKTWSDWLEISVGITHCLDLDLNDQKTEALLLTMVSYLKKRIKHKREKKTYELFWRAALTGHGQSSQLADFWKSYHTLLGSGSEWPKDQAIVIKYSGHAIWSGPILRQNLWQLSRLAWKHKHANATYLLFILEEIKIA